jgi:multidrug resistance efflux pump
MKTTTRLVTALALLIFVWYLFANRITPYTANARVKAIIVDVVPQVSGYVSSVPVTNAQVVEAGTLLARIDPQPFELEVEKARSDLQMATQEVGASSAQVEAAEASLSQARALLENTQKQSRRTFELERLGHATKSAGDQMRAQLVSAEGRVAGAEAELERAKQQLGAKGKDNAKIQAAIAALGLAQLNLKWTELHAPARGVVVDLTIGEGTYARAGQPLMTFLSFDDVWIEAYLTENNLGRVAIGNPVEAALDGYPGRIFEGIVTSFTPAAAAPGTTTSGGLPKPPQVSGWMRDPQRFPVRIRMLGYEGGSETSDIRRELNGQADVIVYTGNNQFLNALGAGWIRLMSWISYAY